jgi:RHS repeat-associated protein
VDNQGTFRDITNNVGAVQNHIRYDSFGKITSQTNANFSTRFNYTGREYDAETGLYFYRSRYYDPVVGRFIGEDAIGFGGGDANLYRYVGNGPTNFADPFGVAAFDNTVNPLDYLNLSNNSNRIKYNTIQGIHNISCHPLLIAGLNLDELLCNLGIRRRATAFRPVEKFRSPDGLLTDGTYRVLRSLMQPHETGSTASGRSQFLTRFRGEAADTLVLDAARLADQLCLWVDGGRKAKVQIVNSPIGILGSGKLTHWITIHRRANGIIHGHPSSPPK